MVGDMSQPQDWTADEPPVEPPSGCHDPALWREMRQLWGQHQRNQRDGLCECGGRWPCRELQLAFRGLVNSCTLPELAGDRGQADGGQPTLCRWCGAEVWKHPLFGWLHCDQGLFLCQGLPPGAPPLSVAEPA